MAFKVGAIISKLTLDKSGWDKAAKGVAADQKKMQGMSDKTAKKFKAVGKAMTVAGGAIVASLGLMTKKFVDTGDWIDKMSKRTGLGAESLSELAYAADLSGASLTDVEKSVKRMSGTILDAHSGLETYVRAFDQMGVSVDELMQMNPEQQFLTISEAIATIEDPTIRAALAQDVFGRSGTALLPMMADGAEGLQKMREEARELGIIYTTETAQSAADLKDAQTALKESVKGLSMAFTQHLVPLLTDLVKKITGTVARVSEWARENPKLAKTIIKIGAGLGGLMTVLGPMVMIVPKLIGGIGSLAKGFTLLLSPVGLLVGALAALTIGYMKVKAAQDAANKSTITAAEQEHKLEQKLWKAAEAAGMTAKEFLKLRDAYKGNTAEMAMAIKTGKEGVELQKALAETGKEQKEEYEKTIPVVSDLTGRFQGYLDEVTKVKEETKTWVDYLKDIGLMTLKEKEDRVNELQGYLGELKEAYDKGLISLEAYTKATTAANDEIKDLSETLDTTAVPAARDMSAVWDNAVTEMEVRTGDFVTDTKTKTGEVETTWGSTSFSVGGILDGMFGKAKGSLSDIVGGFKGFGLDVGGIFKGLKGTVGGFLDGIMGKAKGVISGLLKGFGGIGKSIKGIIGGIGKMASGFSPGGVISGAISGAVGGLVSGLISGSKMKQQNQFLQEVSEHTFTIKDLLLGDYKAEVHTIQNILRDVFGKTASLNPKLDAANKTLRDISKNTEPIKKMVSAQHGAIITKPTLAALHGSQANPEIVSPVSKLIDGFKGIGGGSANLTQAVNVQINIKNQLDAYAAQEITRKQIVPNVLKAIELDAKNKTKMRQILGVQV